MIYRYKSLFSLLVLLIMFLAEHSFAADNGTQYFFQREASSGEQSSCEKIMDKLSNSESIDELTGEIIYNLKYINIHYLLEDYDDATKAGRNKKYVNLNDLKDEIKARKRDIYCRVEFAIHISKQPPVVTSPYQDFIDSALEKIDDTYKSAQKSLKKKNYERARYAFDLIAPYRDSYDKHLETVAILTPTPTPEPVVAIETKTEPVNTAPPQTQVAETAATITEQTEVVTGSVPAAVKETTDSTTTKIEQQGQQTETVLAETKTATIGPILKAVLASQVSSYQGPISNAANSF